MKLWLWKKIVAPKKEETQTSKEGISATYHSGFVATHFLPFIKGRNGSLYP